MFHCVKYLLVLYNALYLYLLDNVLCFFVDVFIVSIISQVLLLLYV
jgi:hypothetical protein